MKRKPLFLLIQIAIAFTITNFAVNNQYVAEAYPANSMWVHPSTIILTPNNGTIGYKFNVTVWLNVSGIQFYSYSIGLLYNRTQLKALRGGFTKDFTAGHDTQTAGPIIDKSYLGNGSVLATETLKGEDYIQGPKVGTLIWIEFQVIATPPEGQTLTSQIDITTCYPEDTWVMDYYLQYITLNTYNAIYTFISGAPPPPPPPPPPPEETTIAVDPREIIDPTMLPSSTFKINITVENVQNMKIIQFNLSYDTQILSWLSVILLKVEGQTPSAKIISDDESGFVWAKLTYPQPVTISTKTPLLIMEFHVDSLGSTPLDLHDTKIINSTGEEIPHSAIDGYFCSLIRDISITAVAISREWAYPGWPVQINVTVKNKGLINETFNLWVCYDNNVISNVTVKDLPPENEVTIILTWDTTNATECHIYTITAYLTILPYEQNTNDNVFIDGQVHIRMKGDIDGDGKVTGTDLTLVCLAFGSYPGHARWNPNADIKYDGRIDGLDLVFTCRNFGKSCQI